MIRLRTENAKALPLRTDGTFATVVVLLPVPVNVGILVLTDVVETEHGRLFTRAQNVFDASAPFPRMRYFVDAKGQTTKVAFPFAPDFDVIFAEHAAIFRMSIARTNADLSKEEVETEPAWQRVSTFAVAATRQMTRIR